MCICVCGVHPVSGCSRHQGFEPRGTAIGVRQSSLDLLQQNTGPGKPLSYVPWQARDRTATRYCPVPGSSYTQDGDIDDIGCVFTQMFYQIIRQSYCRLLIMIEMYICVCMCVYVCVCACVRVHVCVHVYMLSGDVSAGQDPSRPRPRRMLNRDLSPETFLCDAPGQHLYEQTVAN